MDFVQSYGWPGRRPRTESGQVFLRRPGLMRWEYREPSGKLFLSDGETIHFYLPDRKQVRKVASAAAGIGASPFSFLLGRGI